MKNKQKVVSIAVTGLLIFAIILCVTVVSQVLSKGYVSLMGRSVFRVVTGSMEPTIPTGALLISKETPIEEIKVNDIICFRSQSSEILGQSITHRVVEIHVADDGELCLETRGDANQVSDGYLVTERNLIGRVVTYTKEGNLLARIMSVLTSRIGFLSCIVFPVLLVAGYILKDSVKSIQKELEMVNQMEAQPVQKPLDWRDFMTQQEYDELKEILRREIMEELARSAENKTT